MGIGMRLSPEQRKNLDWLAENWQRKRLARLSPFDEAFYSALLNVINNCESRHDIELVIEGTSGRVADGYAHLLDVEPEELAMDSWVALRRLGDISKHLRDAGGT